MAIDPNLLAAAADWHVQLAGDNPDFDGFTAWLETSEAHVRAYDRVIEMEAALDDHHAAIAAALPANDDANNGNSLPAATPNPARRRFLIAAMLAVMAVPSALWLTAQRTIVEASGPAQRRSFALDDRTRIALDTNSAISHRKGRTDSVELDRGAALFNVRHDPEKRFAVVAGDVEIVDLGTQFEVTRHAGHISVAVAEGLVELRWPKSPALALRAGQRADITAGEVVVSSLSPASVASWRAGRLIFQDAPLSQVAQEVSRYTALPVVVDPAIANRRFSGVLTIGDGRALDTNLASFMGLARRRDDKAIRLGARP